MIILGNSNADPRSSGGPLASTPSNEHGQILLCYLSKWSYASDHLHTCSTPSSHTYLSEAHGTYSTTDHILLPVHPIPRFSNCYIDDKNPLNLSDHSPVCTSFSITLTPSHSLAKKRSTLQSRRNWSKVRQSEQLSTYTGNVELKLQCLMLPNLDTLIESPSLNHLYLVYCIAGNFCLSKFWYIRPKSP